MICLDGLHLLMSAIGGISHTVRGSGIDGVLGQIFGPNVIMHILSGKVMSQVLRVLLLEKILKT